MGWAWDDLGVCMQAKPQETLLPWLFRGLSHKDFSTSSCLEAQRPFQAVGQRITSAFSCRARLVFHKPLTAAQPKSQAATGCTDLLQLQIQLLLGSPEAQGLLANSERRAHNTGTAALAPVQRKVLLPKMSQQPSCICQSREGAAAGFHIFLLFWTSIFFNSGNR